MLFGSCCSNVISLEKYLLVQQSTLLVTVIQFSVVTVECLLEMPVIELKIPFKRHLGAMALYLVTSVLNNLVFQYNVTMPVHIICKSLSTCFNMLLGVLFYGKRYPMGKVVGNLVIIVGVCTVTLSREQGSLYIDWGNGLGIGVILLVLSMVSASWLGLYTEITFRQYGLYWQENLLMIHLASLPAFLLLYKQLHLEMVNTSWNLHTVVLLTVNCITQLICVKSVNKLSSITSSLNLNLVLTLRKFISLLISVCVISGSSLTTTELQGCALVVLGLIVYSR